MSDFKLLLALVKYVPYIGGVSMILHVIQLLLGYNPMYAHYMFGFSILGTFLLLLASSVFKFGRLHKLFILYNFITESCIKFQKGFGFGSILTTMRWIVLIIGLYLLGWFIYGLVSKNRIECVERLRRSLRQWYLRIKQRRSTGNSVEHSSCSNEQIGSSRPLQCKSKNYRKKRKRRSNSTKPSNNTK